MASKYLVKNMGSLDRAVRVKSAHVLLHGQLDRVRIDAGKIKLDALVAEPIGARLTDLVSG
jgi:hypothetical protein